MPRSIVFGVNVPLQPKPRDVTVCWSEGGVAYSDSKNPPLTAFLESLIAYEAQASLRGGKPWDKSREYRCTVEVGAIASRAIDVGDYGKLVMDALTGVLWKNDSQVRKLTVLRRSTGPTLIRVVQVEEPER